MVSTMVSTLKLLGQSSIKLQDYVYIGNYQTQNQLTNNNIDALEWLDTFNTKIHAPQFKVIFIVL